MTYLSAPGIKTDPEMKLSAEIIMEKISNYHKIDIEALKSKSRKREKVFARQMCIYFMKKFTRMSLSSIGQKLGGRDHTTAIHSIKAINDLIDSDPEIKREVQMFDRFFSN
jgi:chromosomal replication initiator protein